MSLIGTRMVSDGKTARQLFEEVMANPARRKFGFGSKLAVVNVDFQQAYTAIDSYATAYETDPRQIEYTNTISRLAREKGMPGSGAPAVIRRTACRISNMIRRAINSTLAARSGQTICNIPSACPAPSSKPRWRVT